LESDKREVCDGSCSECARCLRLYLLDKRNSLRPLAVVGKRMGMNEWREKGRGEEGGKGGNERMGRGSCAPTEVFRSLRLYLTSNSFVKILVAILEYNSAMRTNFR